jgi:hypothetical protein
VTLQIETLTPTGFGPMIAVLCATMTVNKHFGHTSLSVMNFMLAPIAAFIASVSRPGFFDSVGNTEEASRPKTSSLSNTSSCLSP